MKSGFGELKVINMFFSIDYIYIYENGLRTDAAVWQINRCTNRTLTQVNGTKGYADVSGKIPT